MAVLALATFMFAACGEKNISVITRESGSGTRSAFEELVSKDGVTLKKAELVSGISAQSSTSAVISQVASIPTAIGFVSLGSVDSSVKVLQLEGVEANSANVINNSYKLARPFVVAWNDAFGENGESLTALPKTSSVISRAPTRRRSSLKKVTLPLTLTTVSRLSKLRLPALSAPAIKLLSAVPLPWTN